MGLIPYLAGVKICGQEFTSEILERIEQTAQANPEMSRRQLSRQVCEWLNWRSQRAEWQLGSCRKALARLQRRGRLNLPAPQKGFAFERGPQQQAAVHPPELGGELAELGDIQVEPVSSRYSQSHLIWRTLLQQHHPLGAPKLCGAQIRYLVRSEQYGYLGALAFSAAAWALQARDEQIGWTETARRTHLPQVVCNDRFLIAPSVQVPNLASHVLALALRRLPEDWQARYGLPPVLVETFIDPRRCDGACYRAANWIEVGQTTGRRDGTPKTVLLHPLAPQWREQLCEEPAVRLGEWPRLVHPQNWAEEEFGTVRLYDERLKQRLFVMAQDFYNRPVANIPEACGSKARTMGAYRFFQNEKINMDLILTAHTESTIERIKQHKVVLAPQDTTTLNYCTHAATEGLGPINNADNSSVGLLLHDTLAFSPAGTPLGIVDAQCWARDPVEQGKADRRKELPIEAKESIKWLRSYRKLAQMQTLCPQTMLVSIGDRESDIYELFLEAKQTMGGPQLLVRAEKSRQRQVEELEPLWGHMARQPLGGELQVHIPRRGSRPAREAVVEVRFGPVTLVPPKDTNYPPLQLWAVYLWEPDPTVAEPVEWMLLSTVAVQSFEEAKERVEWYTGRWGIEVYHRTLKSGCRIRDRQLGTADRLEACLGIDMVVAWRIYHLTMLGREVPDHPCTGFFEDVEWKALCCLITHRRRPPQQPPSMKLAVCMVGLLGGHLGRKSDGMPGTQTLWRGLQRLDTAVQMYCIFTHEELPQSWRSYPQAMHPLACGP